MDATTCNTGQGVCTTWIPQLCPFSMAESLAKRARTAALEARVSTLALPMLGTIYALTVDIDGTVFVATTSALYVIAPSAGFVANLAGSRSERGCVDGGGLDALFNDPHGCAVASDGSLLVADTGNHRLRRVTPHGTVSTVAGGEGGFADGMGTAARLTGARHGWQPHHR